METKRLHSYMFNCPCCTQPHARLFEYYAKFRGYIPDNEPLSKYSDVSMIERVVMDEDNFAGRSLSLGDSVFRCGNCFEFFKFEDNYSDPVKLLEEEQVFVRSRFKPVTLFKQDAIKNAFEMLKKLTTSYDYQINEFTGEIIFADANGKEYSFNIGNQLVDGFFKDNPNFDIKETINIKRMREEENAIKEKSQKGA